MPEISLFALIGEASIYTVFPGLITYGIMYFVKRHIAHVRAQRRYGELIGNVAKATGLKRGMVIVSEIESLAEEPKVEPLKPAHAVMFRVPKGKRDVCKLHYAFAQLEDEGGKYKTDRFSMNQTFRVLSTTRKTIFTAKYQKKLQILTVYPPTKHRKNWYISVQKYDEEGNKNDLEKVYLNKGSTFVYGYDIEVEK